ncbi:heavy metal-associated domain-containing protein [Aeromicrobium sp. CF4.19]|uniref:heavy-metal-associated domain-containing protein n=1 Tax=Aeromicrobium sp. CF4.19 TaxID=3373082 RepID=UPI003EE548E0
MSTIWFDPDDDPAELVKALEAEGYDVRVRREGFAGEEDSEDRSLVVTAEPFDEGVEALVDVYGGWLPGDERLPDVPPPGLPDGPMRLKDR